LQNSVAMGALSEFYPLWEGDSLSKQALTGRGAGQIGLCGGGGDEKIGKVGGPEKNVKNGPSKDLGEKNGGTGGGGGGGTGRV